MILDLPRELQLQVFGWCCVQDTKNLSLISSDFNKAVKSTLFHSLRIPTLHLLSKNIDREDELDNLRLTKSLRLCNIGCAYYSFANKKKRREKINYMELTLKYKKILKYCDPRVLEISCYFPRSAFRVLSRFRNLRELHVTGVGTNMDNALLADLSETLPCLKVLNLSNSKVKDAGLCKVKELFSLETLNMSGCVLSDAGISHISRATQLKDLNIRNCPKVTDMGIHHLRTLLNLKHIRISGCFQVTDNALSTIGKLHLLEVLDIARCRDITDNGMRALSKLKMLKNLNMCWCRRLSDRGIFNLGCLEHLRKLDITGTDITDASLAFVSKFPLLEVLNVTATDVSDSGLPYLNTMKSLRMLSWVYTKITEEGLTEHNMSHFV